MSRIHSEILRGLVALGMVGAAAGCTSNEVVFEPRSVDPIFTSYVAIGNSITAGFCRCFTTALPNTAPTAPSTTRWSNEKDR